MTVDDPLVGPRASHTETSRIVFGLSYRLYAVHTIFGKQEIGPVTIGLRTIQSLLGQLETGMRLPERGTWGPPPLMIDGKLIVTTPWSKAYAFDAKTGEQLWKYDPR